MSIVEGVGVSEAVDGVSHEVQETRHRTPANRRVRWADDHASGNRGQPLMSSHAGGDTGGSFPRDRNLQAIVTDSKTERAIVQHRYNPYD